MMRDLPRPVTGNTLPLGETVIQEKVEDANAFLNIFVPTDQPAATIKNFWSI